MAAIGKINLNNLIGIQIADVETDVGVEKCAIIPLKANDVVLWEGELQLWFRIVRYREPRGRFTHFLMKFIPRRQIKKLSAAQMEVFANHSIGAIMQMKHVTGEEPKEEETPDFIQNNI